MKRKALVVLKPVTVAIDSGSGKDVPLGGRREKKVARIWLLKREKRNEALIVPTKCLSKVINSNPTTLPKTEILKVSNFGKRHPNFATLFRLV